nr:putative membrane protein [uncultured bacterium]
MATKIAFWAVGLFLGFLCGAGVLVVLAVVFAAQANVTFAEFLGVFQTSSFAMNMAAFAGIGAVVMESCRRRQSRALRPAPARD